MSKIPAFQFYPADWRKDPGVQSLSFHDRGVWFEILCLMHESEQRGKLLLNGKAMPEDALARLLGLDKQQLTKTLATLAEFGVASACPETGALMSRRMVRDEILLSVRRERGKLGAEHGVKGKEFGSLGGRPRNVTSDNPPDNPPIDPPKTPHPIEKITPLKPPPSSSSSSSNTKTPTARPSAGEVIPEKLRVPGFLEAWEAWKKYRAEIKHKLTASSAALQLKKFADWGPDRAIAAIYHTIEKGWQGIQEPTPQRATVGKSGKTQADVDEEDRLYMLYLNTNGKEGKLPT